MNAKSKAKIWILIALRSLGAFWISRAVTRNSLRILCYHGLAIDDEFRFKPGLFIRRETFASRLDLIQRLGFRAVPLSEAVSRAKSGCLDKNTLVLTIDDGWHGTYSGMLPELESRNMTATLYLSTYYFEKGTQVANVAVDYLAWKIRGVTSEHIRTQLSERLGIHSPCLDGLNCALHQRLAELSSAAQRQEFVDEIGQLIVPRWQELSDLGLFRYMSLSDAREFLASIGDIQLHTHRHQFPVDDLNVSKLELIENRASLKQNLAVDACHLCYPSGEYSPEQFDLLKEQNIESATTTKAGLNTGTKSFFELERILDSDDLHSVEIEAELSGLIELWRLARSRFG